MIAPALFAALALASTVTPRNTRPLYVEGQVLARLPESLAASRVLDDLGATVAAAQPGGWSLVVADRGTSELMAGLRASGVDAVEPNYYAWTAATVDPIAQTWTPSDTYLPMQWNLARMPQTWYYGRGSAGIVVAVLDTGLHVGASEQPLSVLPGRDFVNDDFDADDDNGHGTHIASIIAQSTDNLTQAAGMAPGVTLLPVKVLNENGRGTVSDLAEGIKWAADAGARVINLSLALPPGIVSSQVLSQAVSYAAMRGVVVVAASGNHGAASVSLPAALNAVIAVGAVSSALVVAPYSNRGMALDLVAPGGDSVDRDLDGHPDGIAAHSLDPESGAEGLYLGSGTSQASAHVSAAAALLMSLGESGRDRIRTLLELTAVPTGGGGAGWSTPAGYGMLDVTRAITLRGVIATVPAAMLQGNVPNQPTAGGVTLENPVALVVAHPSGRLLLVRDSSGTYGMADSSAGEIALYRLFAPLDGSDFDGPGEIAGSIDAAGSVLAYLGSAGVNVGQFAYVGGLDALIDASGGFLSLLDASGGVLVLLDASGGAIALIDASGGVLSMLESAGGLLGLIGASGGFMGLIESAGGMLAMIELSGGWTWILESTGRDLSLLDGLEPLQTRGDSGGGRERAQRGQHAKSR